MDNHTKEPWKVGARPDLMLFVVDKDGNIIADTISDMEDARRIAACVNACGGIDTEYMEKLVSDRKTIDTEMRERIYKIADLTKQRDDLLHWQKTVVSASPLLERCLQTEKQRDELAESLKDILARFESCIEGGNGELPSDAPAIAKAKAAILNAKR